MKDYYSYLAHEKSDAIRHEAAQPGAQNWSVAGLLLEIYLTANLYSSQIHHIAFKY